MKLNSKQLRSFEISSDHLKQISNSKKNDIYIILDNVLDTYNIGAIFRLADAVAAKRVIICGASEIPPNHRIKKASINTTEIVDWSYFETTEKAIEGLRAEVKGLQVVAVEQSEKSVPYDQFEYKMPVALIVGHETSGVSKEVLDLCDGIVEMPMYGINISLNVMVSLGIVLYKALESLSKSKLSDN